MLGQSNLLLSEALLTLVDNGELREGSDAYLAAQKVISEGEAALSDEEERLWREEVVPKLGDGFAS
ncbi:hypothetical protein CXZ10_04735 [Pleomorphomonas diazotrophica]|uniref:Uncharacterized protein n=1 Tax=Pleomorphomonas diazotrophica TaxID=1166257 RepID=A0A1I4QHT3_9HYPH|nr:hypothetical protein [Pleomorphomonas diazotrophica]PKR90671.1 hypothetical protein CXZ10_04735 [Pleomorphomonas diazotrophica]SFM39245.1 hypothetical protein SAMN05192571_101366 [Pleomorphomonas diazotrophica]